MLLDAYLKIIGISSIILTWSAIVFILLISTRALDKSVSHHAAMKKSNHVIFALLMTASLVLMSIFMYVWLIPTYHLSTIFALLVGLAILLELVTTWVPLRVGWRYAVHQACSYGAAFLLPLLLLVVVLSPSIDPVSMWVSVLSLCVMVALLYLFIFVRSVRRHYLIYQNVYIVAFHVSILSMILNDVSTS